MTRHRKQMVAAGTGLFGLAVALAVAIWPGLVAQAPTGQAQAGTKAPSASRPVSAGVSGMTVHIDPRTGAVLSEPAPGTAPLTLSPRELNARSTSGEGLVVEQSPVPGGGYKIDLQGRFESPLIATIDANGKVRMQHLPETPATSGHR